MASTVPHLNAAAANDERVFQPNFLYFALNGGCNGQRVPICAHTSHPQSRDRAPGATTISSVGDWRASGRCRSRLSWQRRALPLHLTVFSLHINTPNPHETYFQDQGGGFGLGPPTQGPGPRGGGGPGGPWETSDT